MIPPAQTSVDRTRIFVGVPCYGQVSPEVLEDWMRFMYHCGRRLPQFDFVLGIKTKSEQFRARNAIVDAALQMACDYTLMIDDDMIIDAAGTTEATDAYGFIERLIAHDKDICGIRYYQRGGNCSPVLMAKLEGGGYRFLRDEEITGGLQRVDVAGGGLLLIKTRVFDRLKPPYFGPEFEYGTDIQLCAKATEKGFEVWADTSIEFGHLKYEQVIVTSRNRHQFQLADTLPGEAKRTFVSSELYQALLDDACEWTGYRSLEEMTAVADVFMQQRATSGLSDADWYRQFPKERVARQVWFNTLSPHKRQMTEFILNAVDHRKPLDILDFGCGIGIPAFVLASKGHRVTACDIAGTGTFEFLKWRAKKHGVPITFHESTGGVPALGAGTFNVVVAMDCLEHIQEWPRVLEELAARIPVGDVLFANNGILDDTLHPEHYTLENKAFLSKCIACDLMPFNLITYTKRLPQPAVQTAPHQELAHA